MASSAPALYHDEPSDTDLSVTGSKVCSTKSGNFSNRSATRFAGAAIVVVASMSAIAPHAEGREVTAYAQGGADFYVDERALLIDGLRQYEQLANGWDGGIDDIAPSRAAIDEAIQFVENLPPFIALPEPMVSSDGEVGLFWHSGGLYLDIGFRGCGECSYFGKTDQARLKGRSAISSTNPIPSDLLDFFVALSDDREMLV